MKSTVQLVVRALPLEDTWKDVIRLNKKYRRDDGGRHIPRGRVCRISVGNRSKWVIAHGREADDAVIQMDLNVRLALGVKLDDSYFFTIEHLSWLKSLWFPWKASDPIYRLPSQLSLLALLIGIVLGVLGILVSVIHW